MYLPGSLVLLRCIEPVARVQGGYNWGFLLLPRWCSFRWHHAPVYFDSPTKIRWAFPNFRTAMKNGRHVPSLEINIPVVMACPGGPAETVCRGLTITPVMAPDSQDDGRTLPSPLS